MVIKELVDMASKLNDKWEELQADPKCNDIFLETVWDIYVEICEKIANKWLKKLRKDVGHRLCFNSIAGIDNISVENGKMICDFTSLVPDYDDPYFSVIEIYTDGNGLYDIEALHYKVFNVKKEKLTYDEMVKFIKYDLYCDDIK